MNRSLGQWPSDFDSYAQRFFEPQLVDLELGGDQIATQSLEELQESLERINDAIANPGAFGSIRLQAVEIGAMKLLLERKKLIKTRIRDLRSKREIKD
ncbi:MAG: hypothetical protein F6K42_04740 [Leptolyngbya sp. SIO1D8]|nr:hypothetical protein [Leptolyngbya sp. SIO1D8]